MRDIIVSALLIFWLALATASNAQTSGMLTLERWDSIGVTPADTIDSFTRDTVGSRLPDTTTLVAGAEIPRNVADDYGVRLRR